MSRSKLRNKWMQERYRGLGRYFVISNMKDIDLTTHCSAYVHWLQESTSFGGHSIPKGGHRRVSGLVRANVKEEVRKQIESELNEEG